MVDTPAIYETDEVLAAVDGNLLRFLIIAVIVFAGYYGYYIAAIRSGFRERTHAMPIAVNMYNTAHDVLFVSLFHRWFFEIGHWLYKAFWVSLVVYVALECVVHYQTIRFSHRRLAPSLGLSAFVGVYLFGQVAVFILLTWLLSLLPDDPLMLISISTTVVVSITFSLPFAISRADGLGLSRAYASSLVVGNAGFFFFFMPLLDDDFASPEFLAIGATCVLATLVSFVLTWRNTSSARPRSARG